MSEDDVNRLIDQYELRIEHGVFSLAWISVGIGEL